ncbi:hypothetical protein K7432_013566 [Basidiobolus ranarum]|uniref:Cytochrome P450 n=1 Tax=Basidiobolus ranarum TaxID=34480 RepID=A0ABR2VQP1_9FUNG
MIEIIIIIGLSVVLWSWLTNPIKNYNSPNWLPVLGNTIELLRNKDTFVDWITEVSEKFDGQPWAIKAPFQPVQIISNDPQTLQYILKDNFNNFVKGATFHDILEPLLGDGIFNADGEVWQMQRKKTSRIFTGRNFRDFISKVSFEEASKLHQYLGEVAKNKGNVDVHDVFHRLTMDAFCRIAFGYNMDSLTTTETPPFALAFNRIQSSLAQRMINPFWKITELLNGDRKQLNADISLADEQIYNIINKRRNNSSKEEYNDLLSIYLSVSEETHGQDDKFLRDMIMNIMLAGRDTTGQALSYTLYCLLEHPEKLERLREEIRSKPKMTANSDLSNVVSEYPYVHAVFKEALRLFPSVPTNMKECVRDCVLPDGTVIKKGWTVGWSTLVVSSMKSTWGEDAEKFKPERWIAENEKGEKHVIQVSQFKYPVFHAGPR